MDFEKMEKTNLQLNKGFIITWNIFAVIAAYLVATATRYLPNPSRNLSIAFLGLFIVTLLCWIYFLVRIIRFVHIVKKDEYLREAFEDEYFQSLRLQASKNSSIAAMIFAILLIIGNGILHLLKIDLQFPLEVLGLFLLTLMVNVSVFTYIFKNK